MTPLVLDTNIVLDGWVFQDPQSEPWQRALRAGSHRWLASADMRDELARVLGYPNIVAQLAARGVSAQNVMAQFDALAVRVPLAPRAPVICQDADDQKFIDLAVAHQALLLSRDRAVLCLHQRLRALSVSVRSAL